MLDSDIDAMTEDELRAALKETRFQIRKHMIEEGHDRCWISDKRLYDQTLPEGCQARFLLPSKEEWDRNCKDFCEGDDEVKMICRALCGAYWHLRQPDPNVAS